MGWTASAVAKLRAMKATFSHPCLWLRALVPSEYVRTPLLNPEEVVQGIWPSGHLDHDLVIGTDASGGRFSSDPRLRAVGWAVVLGPQKWNICSYHSYS